ncbi:hypothetical protein AAT19DRAFT_13154 [Rhodotorula toruloides]|uniref:Uncharacterized protein n=1 Tax=Rhodotorula toruloides TaxID=5286 RepID=A0A2T0ADQ9_RHOTO|nr:hypothetical protein AAT19DRAFT_13154 [Rhodotorula toruloides]
MALPRSVTRQLARVDDASGRRIDGPRRRRGTDLALSRISRDSWLSRRALSASEAQGRRIRKRLKGTKDCRIRRQQVLDFFRLQQFQHGRTHCAGRSLWPRCLDGPAPRANEFVADRSGDCPDGGVALSSLPPSLRPPARSSLPQLSFASFYPLHKPDLSSDDLLQ